MRRWYIFVHRLLQALPVNSTLQNDHIGQVVSQALTSVYLLQKQLKKHTIAGVLKTHRKYLTGF